MREGDRVRHKKYGLGKVLRLYPKNNACRVEYDSGHVTVNSQARVQVVPRASDDDTLREATPTQPKPTGSRHDRLVDYKRLERARQVIAGLFPDADHVVPRLYGLRVYCEVWSGGAAEIYFVRD